MSYIDRTADTISTTVVGEATLTVSARKVGTKVVAEVTEINRGKSVSKTRLHAIVRETAKELLPKPGTPRLMATVEPIMSVAHHLDENGHRDTHFVSVGTHTFVLGR